MNLLQITTLAEGEITDLISWLQLQGFLPNPDFKVEHVTEGWSFLYEVVITLMAISDQSHKGC